MTFGATRSTRWLARSVRRPYHAVAGIGHQATFVFRALAYIPLTLKSYPNEVMRLLGDICWGGGAIVVGGGVIGVMVLVALFTGASVGIEGFNSLDLLGLSPFTGFVSAYVNTREIAPLAAAIAFASQAGCRYTAQLGSMRVSEEIDALESMALRPLPYLVTTRVLAGFIAILPLYLIGMSANYLATQLVLSIGFGQSTGTFQHYFHEFLIPVDLFYSGLKAVVFVMIATLVHCYFGYYAHGGPQGVGAASGRAIRTSLIAIVVTDMIITIVLWGVDPGIRISG
jgi:phospholipid/cholesterol/gamma-HCH transport system permease protein